MKEDKQNIDAFTELSLRYTAEDVSSEEIFRMEEALLADPALRQSFLEMQMLEQGLCSLFEGAGVSEELVQGESQESGKRDKGRRTLVPLATAAVILIGIFFYYQGGDEVEVIGPVVSLEMGARWKERGVTEGERLEAGQEYVLEGGSVRLQLTSGASVAVQGSARFQVPKDSDEADFVLLGGDVVVRNEGGTRVRVATQERLIVCEGGAFGVQSDAQGRAKLCVLNGEVKVEDYNKRPALLTAGFAAPVEALPSGITLMSSKDRQPMQLLLMLGQK